MNKLFYKSAKYLDFLPIEIMVKITRQKVVLPFYHTVSDKELIHLKHLYAVRTVRTFENDLDFLLKHFKPVSYEELLSKKFNNIRDNSFVLTFDDGLREFHDVIAPILLRKGIPAVCFLNSAFVGNKELFFRYKCSILIDKLINHGESASGIKGVSEWFKLRNMTYSNRFETVKSINYQNRTELDSLAKILDVDFNAYLQEEKPYLDEIQINALAKQGFAFGAHSVDHPYYAELMPEEQVTQTRQSVDYVSSEFSQKHRMFAFPFSDFGVKKVFFDTIFDAEKPVADLTFGTAGLKKDSVSGNIQRIAIERDNFSAKEIVFGEYLYYTLKSLIGKNRIERI